MGKINQPITKELFDKLLTKAKQELSGKKIYVQDAFCGASLQSRKAVRFVTEIAWQAHFVKNMFIRPSQEELENLKQILLFIMLANVSMKIINKMV